MLAHILIWVISAASITLMLFGPPLISEAVWTGAGAVLLCILHLIPLSTALHAVAEGTDVYLFLTGMMLLSELAKKYGVFDWLANIAVGHADGSPARLFTLIYAVGIVVTAFMSNDATAVVLTPAVLTAVKRAKAGPMPCLLTCALIANAASFVLPISNPANLVVFHSSMPPLLQWLRMFAAPSLVSIVSTYLLLRWYSRRELVDPCNGSTAQANLSAVGRISLFGILAVAAALLVASALKMDLGLPTCIAAVVVTAVAVAYARANPLPLLKEISWSVLPLVAALFVIVEAVKTAGATNLLYDALTHAMQWPLSASAFAVSGILGAGTNLVNNLPLGLIAGATLHSVPSRPMFSQAVLIGIDLGPNLSISGSLATILWLIAIRRENMHVTGWQFMKAGLLIMPASLLLTVGTAVLIAWL